VLSIVAWIITMIFILINASLGCYTFQRFTWTCSLGAGCENRPTCRAYGVIFIAVVNVSAFISFLLYVALLHKANKLRNRVLPSLSSDNGSIEEARERERRRKSERRANTTFFILFTAILGVTFPAYLMSIFGEAALYIFEDTPPAAYTIVTVLLRGTPNLITVLDPIVIMRNQDVREVIRIIVDNIKRRQREPQQPEQL
jgi:sterol desaturase/sphingolipid hydroxylase (fatty acid hydroxylase superfamily)